jgi:hypothetical protein
MCNVTEIGEIAVYVTLLEYDNIKVSQIYIIISFYNFIHHNLGYGTII